MDSRPRWTRFSGMTKDSDTSQEAQAVSAARALIAQYGEDAQVIAMMRVSELGFSGDLDGYAHWEMVLAAVEVLTEEGGPPRLDS